MSADEKVEKILKEIMKFDKDNSGTLDIAELSTYLDAVIKKQGQEFWDQEKKSKMFEKMDQNKDGKICLDELRASIKESLSKGG